MDALRVKSALDLREESNACKKAAEHNVVTGMAIAPIQVPLRSELAALVRNVLHANSVTHCCFKYPCPNGSFRFVSRHMGLYVLQTARCGGAERLVGCSITFAASL